MGIHKPSISAWEQLPDWAEFSARSLMEALRLRDPYTYGHCRRVARHSRLLAQAAGLGEWDQKKVEYAALFHDLGKIGIPDAILNKPGRLTAEEALIIREHPVKSVEIIRPLATLPFFEATLPGVLHHHERVDGCGYPFGLSGNDIPLIARIVLIADTFDAMTTTRPYRKGLGAEIAYAELKRFAGRQFDPQLVKIFVQAHPTWPRHEDDISEEFIAGRLKRAA